MNINAANALLKTLEEPSARAWLVLISDNPDKLPATILSRCQKAIIRPPASAVARRWLARNAQQAQDADIDLALEVSGGAPLEAMSLLSEGGLALGRELRDAMLEAAGGQLPAPERIETWANSASQVWLWLSFWCGRFVSDLLLRQGGLIAARPDALANLWQQALEGRAMADSNIRADLLLGKWLLEWSLQVDKPS